MTLIISPWMFYLIGLLEPISITAMLAACCIGCYWIFLHFAKGQSIKPATKALLTLTIIVSIFTPTIDTVTKMLIAQNVTYERVEMVGDTVEDVYNDIMSLFNKEDAKE